MDVAELVLATILGGGSGGIVTVAWNWYTFGKESRRQGQLDLQQRGRDFLDTFLREADSAERRGDIAGRDIILKEHEQQVQAYRKQLAIETSVPPERLTADE